MPPPNTLLITKLKIFISAERLPGRPRETWRRTVVRESKIIGKSWNELKALAYNRTRWKTGVIDFLCPPWDRG